MEKERAELAERQQQLDKEGEALSREEATLWEELNELQFHEAAFHACQGSARAQLSTLEASMAVSRARNMVRELFYISQKGPFGTINGFRLGQLPTEQVEWNEINTALGESALLIITMASLLGVEFSEYVLCLRCTGLERPTE
jgi:beclin